MKLIFKYLKPYLLVVLTCFVLLFGQAASELSLPNLMSDIVTTGIQHSGIEEKIPKVMSKEGMDFLTMLMTAEEKEQFLSAYQFYAKEDAAKLGEASTFPGLKEQDSYVLTSIDGKEKSEIISIYNRSIGTLFTLMQSMESKQPESSMDSGEEKEIDMTQLYPMGAMIAKMPKDQLNQAMETSKKADESLYQMMSVGFTKGFYKELNADLYELQRGYILRTGVKMLLVALAGSAAAILVGFFASRTAARVAQKLRRDVFAKVESFSSAEYDKFSTASLITRTTNDVQQVQMLVVMGLRMMCYAPIMGIGGVIFAVGTSASLSWIIALAVVIMIGMILVIFSIALPKFKALQKLIDRLNLVSRENLSGMMVIRAFGNEGYEEKRFDKANDDLSKTNRFVQRTMSFMMPAMMLMMNFVTLAIVWFGSNAIADSALNIGDMMAFMQYAMQIIMSFLMIAMMFIMVPRASVSAVRIREILDTKLVITDKEKTTKLTNPKGKIEFHHVSFRYPNAESDVLSDLNFTANPGEITAFIGATGSGKSTLINLIPRFYDVTEGSITFDGIDLRDLKQKELRDQIGYVPQKGVLFTGDIASNIRYGKEDADDAMVNEAIETAQAKEFVDAMEEKEKTSISQGGTNVSGGQKQRLSIARALIKHAPVYIFDDSFSALDFKTDATLRHALKETTAQSSVLIVAQRVSTIMHAEQIIVLEEGRIVGKGTHTQLMETCPEYREIAESQLSKEELA